MSRTFTVGGSVSDDVRRRVLEAAGRLGYQPNFIARSLITKRSQTIGVAVGYFDNQFYPAVLESLSVAFGALGYRLLLFTSPVAQSPDPILEEILRYQVDAVLLASTRLTSRFADECRRAGVPVVLLNRKTESEAVSSVTADNFVGGRAVASLLASHQHRRCAFMAGLEDSSTSRDREAGFTAGLAEAGLSPFHRVVGQYDQEAARTATRSLLGSQTRPDALFCANDHMALVALETARAEFGLQAGRDISIAGFDDVALAAWPCFDLTTYAQPIPDMVDRVVAITLRHIRETEYEPVQDVVHGELKLRGSVRL